MEKMEIWENTFPVQFGTVDRSNTLTLAGAFDYFQEAAGAHAELLGVGRAAMEAAGQGWVLSRISVSMERRPALGEAICVRSWPRGWEKLFARRDYDIRDQEGLSIVRARSYWLIVDVARRRPLRPQATMEALPQNEGLDALPGGAGALPEFFAAATAAARDIRRAAYSDIDYNGHVNNVRYVQWIQDSVEPALLEEARQIRLDINYIKEVRLGDQVEIFSAPLEDTPQTWAVEGRVAGAPVFRAKLTLGSAEGGGV